MEIARAAAALFVRQGLRATRAEDIAQAAGIAPRTFYRYFATKEEAVAPLYAAGAQRWIEAVRTAPAGLPVPQALEHAVRHTLTPGLGVSAASWEWLRTLVRLADTSPALRKVWAEVCQASEGALAEILAARENASATSGTPGTPATPGTPGTPGTPATPATPATPGTPGTPATPTTPATPAPQGTPDPERPGVECGAQDPARPGVECGTQDPAPLTPRLRFAAAVAGAAVRVAVESWAATATHPTGPEGPAGLAVRNLRALRDFEWPGTPPVPQP
ncbi:TetR family transcriptional regulator [Streptomyces sp. DSM 40868]|uniref:TetR/AcrR family transcriptional regulator n=2 Tax=Streptomyces TaxID=1883 RepID=A0ABW6YVR6_9ACTN|nr:MULTISPECIES: TetR family transcriptional regulator [Streptomyces]QIS75874.1 TetR family transcriptional regulator [Streptomyces sp. DSM 40868]